MFGRCTIADEYGFAIVQPVTEDGMVIRRKMFGKRLVEPGSRKVGCKGRTNAGPATQLRRTA